MSRGQASPPGTALREGFTTGSAATAAGMAALEFLLCGTPPAQVDVPLPPFQRAAHTEVPSGFLTVPVERVCLGDATAPKRTAAASVIKDGGDDPDATHGARIIAHVALHPCPGTAHPTGAPVPLIHVVGGEGVGRVTLPGLPVPVGEAAINPVPRQQITHGLRRVAARHGCADCIHITVSVPDGVALARHTFNPRLGIVGGISILGTQGTVRPYSHEAWQATIRQGLDVAEATGCRTLCLSTGRRSEKLLMGLYPHLSAQAAVQVADFAEFSLQEAGNRPFSELVWGCFFGKLVKLAQGHSYTHARTAELDFSLLARWCAEAGAAPHSVRAIGHCVTAHHALELLMAEMGEDGARCAVHAIALKAAAVARRFAGRPVRVHVFHLNGKELVRV